MSGFRKALLILASFQALLAAAVLYWAWPLFVDQPLLLNGINHSAKLIKELSQSPPNEHDLSNIAEHYRWLFFRLDEGVLVAMGSAALLFSSSAASTILAFWPERQVDRSA